MAAASGLYLQSTGGVPCTNRIYRQAASQSVAQVTPPKTNADGEAIVTALGPRLLIAATYGCLLAHEPVTTSLLWYNPGTRAEQWLLRAGVVGVAAYPSTENAGSR